MRACLLLWAAAVTPSHPPNAVPARAALRGAPAAPCSDTEVAELAWRRAREGAAVTPTCALQRGQRLALDPQAVRGDRALRAERTPRKHALVAGASQGGVYAVHVSVFLVRESWCAPPCQQPTWEVAGAKPEPGGAYQQLEAAIWFDEHRVALYEFDPVWADRTAKAYFEICEESFSCEAYWAHREVKRLYQATWDASAAQDPAKLSAVLRDAFKEVFAMAYARNPEHVVFTYSGHGGQANGGLFEGWLGPEDSAAVLGGLPKPLSLMNFGGNCVEGRYNMLAHMEPFGEYVIASDLQVTGVSKHDSDEEMKKHMAMRAKYDDLHYLETLLLDRMPIRDAALAMLAAWEKIWGSAKPAYEAEKLKQSKALFDLAQMKPFRTALRAGWAGCADQAKATAAMEAAQCDVQTYVDALGSSDAVAAWKALRIGFVSTMGFFPWDLETHGLGFNFESYEVVGNVVRGAPPCDVAAVQ